MGAVPVQREGRQPSLGAVDVGPSVEAVSTAYNLWYDATSVDGHHGVTCWISHGPRADDLTFDPKPGDGVLVGDDGEEPCPARVVARDQDRVTLLVSIGDVSTLA